MLSTSYGNLRDRSSKHSTANANTSFLDVYLPSPASGAFLGNLEDECRGELLLVYC